MSCHQREGHHSIPNSLWQPECQFLNDLPEDSLGAYQQCQAGQKEKSSLGIKVSLCAFSAYLTVTFHVTSVRFQELRLICALQEDPLQRDQELAPSPELIRDLVTHSTKEKAMGQSIRQDKRKTLLSATRH